MADDRDDRVSAILAYHEATKHSPESVRRQFHRLGWDNTPHPLKVYADLERVGGFAAALIRAFTATPCEVSASRGAGSGDSRSPTLRGWDQVSLIR
ncbi:MAG: hypothetical protein ACRDH0_02710 [Actinomycetota bacterium]